jgi:hypothetical protein
MTLLPRLPSTPVDPAAKRSPWEIIITTTPVILTVLATILAGLSSSEMIQAQYHRSLAAQNQSKAGDQWAFFQSKRIRGTMFEEAADVSGPVLRIDAAGLEAACRQLAKELRAGAQSAQAVQRSLEVLASATPVGAENKLPDGGAIEPVIACLGRPEVRTALGYLGTDRLPIVESSGPPTDEIRKATDHMRTGRNQMELDEAVERISAEDIQQAIDAAQAESHRFEEAAKSIDQRLRDLDGLLRRPEAAAQALHQLTGTLRVQAEESGPTSAKTTALAALDRHDRRAQLELAQLKNFRSARKDYTARRNAREADLNQHLAALYELQVEKSSIVSERHRRRSKNFFYGMLCAQAGVAFASFSLAVRHRSTLWSLAGVAGLIAVAFSAYVYFCV